MFDWLKTILRDHYTEEIGKKVAEEIGKGFVSRADFNTANEAKKQLEAQIADRDKQLDTELARMQKNYAIQTALTGKAHDPADIVALLDMEKVELDDAGGVKTDLDVLLKPIRENKGYLFVEEKPPAPPAIRGAVPAAPPREGGGSPFDAEINQIFGLKE